MSFSNPFSLSSLDGNNGFKINGTALRDRSGYSVSGVGDVNGDGMDDLIIGTRSFYSQVGVSYVVFGSKAPFPSSINLSSLDGNNGFKLNGVAPDDYSGLSVSSAGDINGDGIDDLVIGAPLANSGAGASYVVFGSKAPFSSSINLSGLNGSNGFKLNGELLNSYSGRSVSGAGDIDGDGIADLIIGAYGANSNQGVSYVVFGSMTITASPSPSASPSPYFGAAASLSPNSIISLSIEEELSSLYILNAEQMADNYA